MEHSIDREKVIKGLECCAGQYNYHGCPYKDPCENASGVKQIMLDALDLLKEQEAKTVESIQISRNFYAELTGYCPSCKRPLKSQFNNRFCGNCGQAVNVE